MQGSAIRRIGFRRWQRNIAVALGNAPASDKIIHALKAAHPLSDNIVREHIDWAIEQQQNKHANQTVK
jgi:epoxyqueuosine reductase